MNTIKTNELKKGDWIKLRNGWTGEVWDNRRGNTRVVDVYGDYHEAGSIYAHDIVAKLDTGPTGGKQIAHIEHTPAQLKLRRSVAAFGW